MKPFIYFPTDMLYIMSAYFQQWWPIVSKTPRSFCSHFSKVKDTDFITKWNYLDFFFKLLLMLYWIFLSFLVLRRAVRRRKGWWFGLAATTPLSTSPRPGTMSSPSISYRRTTSVSAMLILAYTFKDWIAYPPFKRLTFHIHLLQICNFKFAWGICFY